MISNDFQAGLLFFNLFTPQLSTFFVVVIPLFWICTNGERLSVFINQIFQRFLELQHTQNQAIGIIGVNLRHPLKKQSGKGSWILHKKSLCWSLFSYKATNWPKPPSKKRKSTRIWHDALFSCVLLLRFLIGWEQIGHEKLMKANEARAARSK